jgi:ATP synthase protein I
VKSWKTDFCGEWWHCTVNEPKAEIQSNTSDVFADQVSLAAKRKLNAQRLPEQGVWFGLGMIGLIGWSVVVPTLLGAALGIWLDAHHPGRHAWTLALMVGGLSLGCLNAWHWIEQEDKAMHPENSDDGR